MNSGLKALAMRADNCAKMTMTPTKIMNRVKTLDPGVVGETSPYPTVEAVTMRK